jgi:hypothetical protein
VQVEFIRDWRWFRRGQAVEIARGRADLLIRLGLARPLSEKAARPPEARTATAEKAPKKARRKRAKRSKKP